MKIQRLAEIIHALPDRERKDLQRFNAYRKGSNTLLQACLESPQPLKKKVLLKKLSMESRAYDSSKSRLLSILIEWHMLNRDIWISQPMKQLLQSHYHAQWGNAKKAHSIADSVQKKAEEGSRITIARLALEIKSSVVQSVFQEEASAHLLQMDQEIEKLTAQSHRDATITSVYVQAAALAEQSMLIRTKQQLEQLESLVVKLNNIDREYKELNFHMWAYKVQGEAYLEMVKGNFHACFELFNQLWLKMTKKPYRIPLDEHRFYQFFQTYTSVALRAEKWDEALKATLLYQETIDKHYGDDQRRKALAHTFLVLSRVGQNQSDGDMTERLKELLKLFIEGAENGVGDFNLKSWEIHVSTDILPLLLKRGFEHQLYRECSGLLSHVSTFKLKKANIATDLILLAPLLQQVILFELYYRPDLKTHHQSFVNGADHCYEIYRKRKETHLFEWQLARLFRGLAYSMKKTAVEQFTQCVERVDSIRPNCLYYSGLMQLFDFDAWLRSKV